MVNCSTVEKGELPQHSVVYFFNNHSFRTHQVYEVTYINNIFLSTVNPWILDREPMTRGGEHLRLTENIHPMCNVRLLTTKHLRIIYIH